MNDKRIKKRNMRRQAVKTGKECAYLSVFVALLLTAQLCFSFLAGVELVTVLFIVYAYVFGVKRGMFAAICFSLLRQMIFGFFPNVLLLYLAYFNLLSVCFGMLGRRKGKVVRLFWLVILLACLCTVCFTLLDDMITPLWWYATMVDADIGGTMRAYFIASLPVMATQTICVGVSVGVLFLPLERIFRAVKKRL